MTCITDKIFIELFENGNDIHYFFNAIFGFLNRCTNFYDEDIKVCEQILIEYLRHWHPENISNQIQQNASKHEIGDFDVQSDSKNYIEEVMNVPTNDIHFCTDSNTKLETLGLVCNNEVEICTSTEADREYSNENITIMSSETKAKLNTSSESFNGAVTEKYSWSQSISEVDIHINLPEGITSSGQLIVLITPSHLKVGIKSTLTSYIDEDFSWKCKPSESVWWISNGKLVIHLQKKEERWWQKLLESEQPLDISKMQCSRPLDELPEDAQNLVQEMFWSEQQKILGKPTAEDIRKRELLKKSWNAEGSPFKGTDFDPSLVNFQ